jgi:hypothetical protein
MNQKGEGEIEFIVVIGSILLIVCLVCSLFNAKFNNSMVEANSKGYLITDRGLNKYSVKLIETRKSTDDNWAPVK